MKISGGCHCGRIAYEATIDPNAVGICHCTDCQSLSGSAYRVTVPARADAFIIRGEPKIYVKIAASGTRRAQAFCPDCGAAIYAAAVSNPPSYSLRVGSIRERAELSMPRRQIWCDSALPWVMDLRGIDQVPRQP